MGGFAGGDEGRCPVGLTGRKEDSGQEQSARERKRRCNVIANHALERRLSPLELKLLEEVWHHRNAFHFAKHFTRDSGVAPESALGRVLQADVEKRAYEHYTALRDSFFGSAAVKSLPPKTLKDLETIL
jgi:hypothetical protein